MNKFYIGATLTEEEYEIVTEYDFETLSNEDLLRSELEKKLDDTQIENIIRNITDSLKKYGKYAINKNTFFAEADDDTSTKSTWWSLWKRNIAYAEKIKGKDLYEFSSIEISQIIKNLTTANYSRKDSMWTFINKYMTWACHVRRLIPVNPCDSINKEEVVKVESNSIRASVYGLDEFYSIMQEIADNLSWMYVAPFLLARYGIVGKNFEYMTNLKWNQIDRENRLVYIYDKNIEQTLNIEVDDRFIETIDNISEDNRKVEGTIPVDFGYVLKGTNRTKIDNPTLSSLQVYKRMSDGLKSVNLSGMSANSLLKSRRLDYIFKKRAERKLNAFDIQDTILMFNPTASAGAYKSLKEEYEALTRVKVEDNKFDKEIQERFEKGDEVLHGKIKDHRLNDPLASEYVEKLREELGF